MANPVTTAQKAKRTRKNTNRLIIPTPEKEYDLRKPVTNYTKAKECLKAGRWDDGIEICHKILEESGNASMFEVQLLLYQLCKHSGDIDAACDHLFAAATISNDSQLWKDLFDLSKIAKKDAYTFYALEQSMSRHFLS